MVEYRKWIERPLAADDGETIDGNWGGATGKSLDECKLWCAETDGCNSITWRKGGDCWLKNKCLTPSEPSKTSPSGGFMSYYMPCTVSGRIIIMHPPK